MHINGRKVCIIVRKYDSRSFKKTFKKSNVHSLWDFNRPYVLWIKHITRGVVSHCKVLTKKTKKQKNKKTKKQKKKKTKKQKNKKTKKQQTTNNKQQTTNNKQKTKNKKQKTTNNKQQTKHQKKKRKKEKEKKKKKKKKGCFHFFSHWIHILFVSLFFPFFFFQMLKFNFTNSKKTWGKCQLFNFSFTPRNSHVSLISFFHFHFFLFSIFFSSFFHFFFFFFPFPFINCISKNFKKCIVHTPCLDFWK